MRRILTVVLVGLLVALQGQTALAESKGFSDVPQGHYAEQDINALRELGVTDGYGDNTFGFGNTLSRAEFVAFLGKLNQWDLIAPMDPGFTDNTDTGVWYYTYVETALEKGIISAEADTFRPMDLITREEMALMILKSLGYDWLAEARQGIESGFSDVDRNAGYIGVLNGFGIVNGRSDISFDPHGYAKREEAAAILMRMYKRMTLETGEVNAFYAIRSHPQMSLIESFDTVSYSWAEVVATGDSADLIQTDLQLDFPEDYELPINEAVSQGKKIYLSVFADDYAGVANEEDGLVTKVLQNPDSSRYMINAISDAVKGDVDFDGIVIDFESIRGEENQLAFTAFVEEVAKELHDMERELVVMVQPADHFDGYDYGAIAEASDRMILMAHDYNAKKLTQDDRASGYTWTPLAPIESVYESLKQVKDQVAKEDFDKVSLQMSFATAQWMTDADGVVTSEKPYTPLYESVYSRLLEEDTTIEYGIKSRNPYATYFNPETQKNNMIWYEDERSIREKIDLAKMFEIDDISIWRLGNIPDYKGTGSKEVYMDLMPILSE